MERQQVPKTSKAHQRRNKGAPTQKSSAKAPQGGLVHPILQLQATLGNQAVQRLLRSGVLQAKLRIGAPGDKYEQEADRVADQIMQMPEPLPRRTKKEEEDEQALQTKPTGLEISPLVQRQEQEEAEEELQTKSLTMERSPLQRQEADEEEKESFQTKLDVNSHLQRQTETEEEEEKLFQPASLQRRATEEEEEPLQPQAIQLQKMTEEEKDEEAQQVSPMIQRQSAELEEQENEEEETVQTEPLIQRQAEEDKEKIEKAMPSVQRQVDGEEEEAIQAKSFDGRHSSPQVPKFLHTAADSTSADIQRVCPGCEEELAQTKPLENQHLVARASLLQPKVVHSQTPRLSPTTAANIQYLNGGGNPLPPSARSFFEPRFGTDFSQVRLHTDIRAAETAKSINAKAFTVGRNIAFGAGEYAPGSYSGRRLLAHELTHIVQQNSWGRVKHKKTSTPSFSTLLESGAEVKGGSEPSYKGLNSARVKSYGLLGRGTEQEEVIPRKRDGPGNFKKGSLNFQFTTNGGTRLIAHELVHIAQQGVGLSEQRLQLQHDTRVAPQRRRGQRQQTSSITVRWRGSLRSSLFHYVRNLVDSDEHAARVVRVVLNSPTTAYYAGGRQVTLAEFERSIRDSFVLFRSIVRVIARETGVDLQRMRTVAHINEALETLRSGIGGERSLLRGGRSEAEMAGERAKEAGTIASVQANWHLLEGNEALSRVYLRLMEHFAAMPVTPAIRASVQGGLTPAELNRIVSQRPAYRYYTNLITQGWAEYRAAGANDMAVYQGLQEAVLEQFIWGNPTARRNQLKIGQGWPERDVLGIVERTSNMLLHDRNGMPLRSFAGGMMRDQGWVGSQPVKEFGININAIEDPALRGILNMLRQQIGEPTRVIARAAQVYFENIELVTRKVRNGLTDEVKRKFADTLPAFVGFLAGHAVSWLLMRSANPVLAAIGAALRGLLTAAGYILQIDFLGSALQRLLEAGNHLVRIRHVQGRRLTELSQYHIEEAARPIQQMVSEIAMSVALGVLGRLIRAGVSIICTRCRISSRIRRTRRRSHRRAAEGRQLGLTLAEIEALRKTLITRDTVTSIAGRSHRGALDHGVPDVTVIRTINRPQRILVAKNGNWVFYRNGTIVVTPAGNPSYVLTAFGRGGRIPQRRLADLQRLYGNPKLRAGDAEPPVRLVAWISQQFGSFRAFIIWP